MKNVSIVLFGSSIMEGVIGIDDPAERWYELMRTRLIRRFPETCFNVVNSAIGGESTRECMARFERDVLACSPDYLLLMVGANNDDYARPERLVPLDEVARHIDDLAARLPKHTQVAAVVLGPVIDEWHGWTSMPVFSGVLAKSGGLNALLEPERELFRERIVRYGWPSIDLYRLLTPEPEKWLMTDGIHLNHDGHRRFAEAASAMMEQLIAG